VELGARVLGLQPGRSRARARRGHVLLLRGQLAARQDDGNEKALFFSLRLPLAPSPRGSYFALAQAPGPQPHAMNFFVTSIGMGKGGDLGGLAGADAHCQQLAAGAGAGNLNLARLFEHAGAARPAGGERTRTASGRAPGTMRSVFPFAQDVGDLHGDTLEQARVGSNLFKETALDEHGKVVNGFLEKPNTHRHAHGIAARRPRFHRRHGSHVQQLDEQRHGFRAQLGHSDRMGGGGTSWNSAHASRACSQADLVATGGAGLFYCFAVN